MNARIGFYLLLLRSGLAALGLVLGCGELRAQVPPPSAPSVTLNASSANPIPTNAAFSVVATIVPGEAGTVTFQVGATLSSSVPVQVVDSAAGCLPTSALARRARPLAQTQARPQSQIPCGAGRTGIASLVVPAGALPSGTYVVNARFNSAQWPTLGVKAVGMEIVVAGGALSSSNVSLSSTVNPSATGGATALLATVTPANASGTVTFKDGSQVLGSASIEAGRAMLPVTFATPGLHSLTAAFGGNIALLPSSSAVVLQTVNTPLALPAPPAASAPVVGFEYDANHNPTKVTQAPGVVGFGFAGSSSYDLLSRRVTTTDPKSGVTQLAYDGRDRLTQLTDPRSLVTQTPRNGLGDVTQLLSPDTGTASHSYDAAGNLLTRLDSRGVLASHSYDTLNRLTAQAFSFSGQPTMSYGWTYDQTGAGFSNGVGRLTSSTHPGGSAQFAYDAQGRLVTHTQRVGATVGANAALVASVVGYAYDAAGNVTSITYPSGRVLRWTYSAGLPSAVTLAKDAVAAPMTVLDQIQFSPFGAAQSWRWALSTGAQVHPRLFDTSGRLVRYPLGRYVRDLTYDAADRIKTYTHYDSSTGTATAAALALAQTFGYDELGRVVSVSANGSGWSIGYDANGNRTGVTLNGVARAYTTSTISNRLSSIANPARSFAYDNAGNTTTDSASYTATYNLAGRLATLTKSALTATFTHDGEGRRVRKFSSSGATSTVIFAYDQAGHLLGEYSNTGAALREYVWLGDTPVAMFTPGAAASDPPVLYFIHADHLDTPRVVIDANNAQRWTWMAEPFGTTAPNTNPQGFGAVVFNLRFPGQYADVETGLNYNFFRDYDASIGRYTQSDPIGLAGGINTYSYVGGNPISYADPDGLQVRPRPGIPGFPIPGVPPGGIRDPDFPPGVGPNASPGWRLPGWFRDWFGPRPDKTPQEKCEKGCDDTYDRDQKDCEWYWMGQGRDPGAYRTCISRARSDHIKCLQDCKTDCAPK